MSTSLLIEQSIEFGTILSVITYGCIFFIQYHFLIRFTKANSKIWYCVLFMALSFFSVEISIYYNFSSLLFLLLVCTGSFLFIKFIFKQSIALSLIISVLINVIEQLAMGVIAPLDQLLYTEIEGIMEYQLAVLISSGSIIIISMVMYWLIAKKIDLKSIQWNRYSFILLLPLMILVFSNNLTENTGLWNATTNIDTETGLVHTVFSLSLGEEFQVMGICAAAFACIFAALFAFRKVMEFYDTEQKRILLEQQNHVQKNYIEEAKIRMTQTMSFRHDIKNHLSIVNGLLEENKTGEARDYLNKMVEVADSLSFACNTGNAVIDVLLNNKFSMAMQAKIDIECNAVIPKKSNLDDFDLCVILANAIDNAIAACRLVVEQKKYISLVTQLDGDFFMIETRNSYNSQKSDSGGSGIGIPNIQEVARKYRGAVTTETESDCFRLNVLLILSIR